MDPKKAMWIAAGVGSVVGGYIPTLWGVSAFSFTSLFFSALGTVAGIWIVFKASGY